MTARSSESDRSRLEHVAVLPSPEIDQRTALHALADVVGPEDRCGVLERAGVGVGLDGDGPQLHVEPVDLGLGLRLALAGGGQGGVGLGQGPLGIGQGGLLTGDVGVEGVEGRRDLGVRRLQHVDLGRDLGSLATDSFALGTGIGGCRRRAGGHDHDHHDEREEDGHYPSYS